jgi:cysteine desulfurase
MDVPTEYAKGTLRLSVGPSTSTEDVDRAAVIIVEEAKKQICMSETSY